MSASNALSAMGTLLKRGNSVSLGETNFTTIAEVTRLNGPNESREFVDVTHMESPGNTREYKSVLKNPGQITVDLNMVPNDATQDHVTGILADFDAGTKRLYQLVFPNAGNATYTMPMEVENHSPAAQVGDKLQLSVTFKVVGQVTRAA